MDEKLIKLIRDKPDLYDMESRRYSDNVWKNKLWDDIGRTLHKDGNECKQRWMSLRSQYRKVLQKKQIKDGQSSLCTRKWRLEESMEFLRDFTKDKPKNSFHIEVNSNEEKEKAYVDLSKVIEITQNITETENEPEKDICFNVVAPSEDRQTTKVQDITEKEMSLATLIKHILEEKLSEKDQRREKDPTVMFFLSMASSVKKFSPYDQHIVKSHIFNFVSQMEKKYLTS